MYFIHVKTRNNIFILLSQKVSFWDITPKFFRILKQFNPFGPDNNKPIFCTKRVFDYGTSRRVGRDQEH
ncbi:MAG: hypothetical protein II193_12020, partial [Lachnospiraceae bacterium]|nr:hypothetical protein [Lachnospiraceae bacterium]